MKTEPKTEVMKDHSVRFPEKLWKEIGTMLPSADLKNNNEFIREAVKFYIEWLKKPEEFRFVSAELESILRATVRDSEERITRMIYKLSVAVAFLSIVTGDTSNYSSEYLTAFYDEAEEVVRKTNGNFSARKVVKHASERRD